MNLPLQRSDIGETWVQPELYLLPDLPKEDLNPCNECHHFEQLNAGCSAFALCKLKNIEVRIDNKSDCKGFKSWDYKEEAKPLNHCSNCNSFDSAIKNDSPWAFCLLKGKYIARDELTTCDDFSPIIPYQAPVKKRRSRGDGSGSIVKRLLSKKTKKEIKSYKQYWYDYELWENGVCLRKGSAYIPKNKLEEIELMNNDKEPVKSILERLDKII